MSFYGNYFYEPKPASDKQIKFLISLLKRIGESGREKLGFRVIYSELTDTFNTHKITSSVASSMIDSCLKLIKKRNEYFANKRNNNQSSGIKMRTDSLGREYYYNDAGEPL